jgi:glycine/D-amino acid oxidase-like deaminating enzyme
MTVAHVEQRATLPMCHSSLPVPNPTTPFWQVPLHPLAKVASGALPTTTDIIIIGSGMTGCSVAKELLEGDPNLCITVLEARDLTSGASARNGGHIVSPSFGDFARLVECFGPDMAVQIAEFTLDNVERTFDAVDAFAGTSLKADSKIRRTEKILIYKDQESFDEIRKVLELWNSKMPSNRLDPVKLLSSKEAEQQYGIHDVVGIAVGRAAAVWPYRLWTGIWNILLDKYRDRFTIEAFTPALTVVRKPSTKEQPHRYLVTTPRGEIETSQVVYCTNAYTPHLLPRLQGRIIPVRGVMSAQDAGPNFPSHGATRSWSVLSQIRQDPRSQTQNAGLYYITQDPETRYMLVGGEHFKDGELLSSDDSRLNDTSAQKIGEVLPSTFDNVQSRPDIKSIWSGIMGFSRDGLPLIGQLPEDVTGRAGTGEWIAAGFSGYGTGYCYSCGQAVAQMMLGRDVSSWVPHAFLLTKERFRNSLTTDRFWGNFLGSLPKVAEVPLISRL